MHGVKMAIKTEDNKAQGKRRKHSIVLEERTKLLKAAAYDKPPASNKQAEAEVIPKVEEKLSICCEKKNLNHMAMKACQCLEDVDCEHVNFQVCQ